MDGSIADVLPAFNMLLEHLETERKRLAKSHHKTLVQGIDAAWHKLNKYYIITDLSPVYIVAVVCDPRRNMEWIRWAFEKRRDWILAAEKSVKNFFESYRDKSLDDTNIDHVSAVTFASWPYQAPTAARSARSTHVDREYYEYVSLPRIPMEENPLVWLGARKNKFPTWYKIAMDILPIPAMSAEIERVFSRLATLNYLD